MRRRMFFRMVAAAAMAPVSGLAQRRDAADAVTLDAAARAYRVQPGGSIQAALERGREGPRQQDRLRPRRHLSPAAHGQALIWFNARHDGITLEARRRRDADRRQSRRSPISRAPSFPAVVNHVVYFGDGISRRRCCAASASPAPTTSRPGTGQRSPIESDDIRKTPFFYRDGGGIKIYARSYPTDRTRRGRRQLHQPLRRRRLGRAPRAGADAAVFRDCVFRDNRTQITGAAFDLLHGSRATLDNCLFVGNVAQPRRGLRRPAGRRRVSIRSTARGR